MKPAERFRAISFLLCFFLLAGLPARADFRFRINEDLGTLDWGYGEVNRVVVQQLMEGLTASGPNGEPLPALAESWRLRKGKAYRFILRKDAKWSDGAPVCAQQFVDAWTRVLDPKFGSPYAHYLFSLKNAREFHAGRIADAGALGAHARGCHELDVELERRAAYFPALASHWVLNPIRLDLIKKLGSAWTQPGHLAVTGPYALESWERDKQYVLARNPLYYGKPPHEQRLRALVVPDDSTALALFHAGSLDWVEGVPFLEKPALRDRPEYRVFPSFVEYHLGFLFGKPGALPRPARCALARALDKREIPLVLKGDETPARGVVPPGLDGSGSKARPVFDPAAARKLWKESGQGSAITVYFYAKDIHAVVMQWLQQQWKKNLGLDVSLEQLEGKTYWSRLQNDPTVIFLSGITASYAHPYTFLSEFLSDSEANWGRFASKDYDTRTLRTAALGTDDKSFARSVSSAQKLLVDDECAVIPLYFRKTSALVAPGWNGFALNPMTYVYLKDVERAPKK